MALITDPTAMSNATRLRPGNILAQPRSPSRSPIRRTQFTAQELDPLLSNLSPDSTLRALQATETISGSQTAPDALGKSIADASAFERELGIRAAVAAQKIREWLQDVRGWPWPSGNACALGLGFSSHETTHAPLSEDDPFIGSLRTSQIRQYKQRLADIQGALDTLEIEEVKDYVLEAHVPARLRHTGTMADHGLNYRRMRDFTALITATIIQALPDLAELNMLLAVWKVRLAVLRLAPEFLHKLDITRQTIHNAMASLRDGKSGTELTQSRLDTTRTTFAEQVSSVGAQVDRMLDLLEGHDDRLPQDWIDTLEKVELDFATWAVEAQRRVLHNEWIVHSGTKALDWLRTQQQQQLSSEGIDAGTL